MILRSLFKVLFLCGLLAALNDRVFSFTQMLSDSMAPSLLAESTFQDVVLVDHLTLKTRPPRRGEIVRLVFHAEGRPDDYFFKRVAGLPGERLEIRNGGILINDKPLEEPPALRFLRYTNEGHASPGVALEIASGAYFVLGDNSLDSYDSRYWGALKPDDMLGLGALIVWPPHRFGRVSAL